MREHELEQRLGEALSDPAPPPRAVARVRSMMAGPVASAWASILERARALHATILLDTRAHPALVGFRAGVSEGFDVLAASEGRELFLHIRQRPGSAGFTVKGKVEGAPGAAGVCGIAFFEAGSASLVCDAHTDREGEFGAEVPAGRYDLAVGLDPPFLVPGLALE
ncbi:MAG: hypothetical protein WD749_14775 [Phycisphaerales bacterium]